jgi:hypothetical protein
MTLDAALEQLNVGTSRLADVLSAVRATVSEDLPDDETSTLALDDLGNTLVELAGEATTLRDRVRSLAERPPESPRSDTFRLVSLAQGALNDIADGLTDRVLACDQLEEFERVARRRDGQWRSWWSVVERGLAECEPAVRQVRDELFVCWRELVGTSPATARASISALDTKP